MSLISPLQNRLEKSQPHTLYFYYLIKLKISINLKQTKLQNKTFITLG